jgi:hypothetical protein
MMVQVFRLDLEFDFLRFRNEWYYLLTGEILGLRMFEREQVDFVWIDALIATASELSIGLPFPP